MGQRHAISIGCVLIILTSIGCQKLTESRVPPLESPELQKLLDASMEELRQKTQIHEAWGLGKFERWEINQEAGELVFSNADGNTAVAPAQIIGSYSTAENTWLWAWANPSVRDALKVNSLQLKEYGKSHGIEKLTLPKWSATEDDAWEMTALATKLCNAQGAYRGPTGQVYVFMTFGKVKISKPKAEK